MSGAPAASELLVAEDGSPAPTPEAARAPVFAPPAEPPQAPVRLLTLLIGAEAALAEINAAVVEALPGHAAIVCPDVAGAIVKAQNAGAFGWTPAVAVIDARGAKPGDLADQLRRLRADAADLDLVVLLDDGDAELWRAALQIVQAPDKLTFLLAPFYRPDAAAAFRAIAARRRALTELDKVARNGRAALAGLKTQVQTLTTELQLARHAAHHDGLTGILNRVGFIEELSQRLARRRKPLTVMMIDLDRFKAVNDTLGHHAGDDLVRKICSGMSGIMPANGVLARLGGDEFGIILENTSDQGVEEFCARALRVCSQGWRVIGNEVQVSASIGVARQADSQSQSEIALMRRADLALYAAKREGRNRHRVFDAELEQAAEHRMSLEAALERALRTGQFHMAYQPIVKAKNGQVLGFEALIRWDSPDHGAVSPTVFVPVAEETGLILDLGDWIARQAFKDCRRWGGPYVSVNLSARQFLRQNVAERVLRYAEEADLSPNRIQIELTETALIDDVERAAHNLRVLRKAGVRVALDDFGTGYSSLTYLNQFAIDCIKIDKSFVDHVAHDKQSAIIVTSVARLAASLGMGVVAEGVETEEQHDILIAAGCGALQGFRFGMPMSPKEARALIMGPMGPPIGMAALPTEPIAPDGAPQGRVGPLRRV